MRVVIHKILDVKPPSARLPSWSKNVGQGDRNVVELSHPLLEITWIEWQLIGAPESKMGTYTTSDLSTERPRLYEYLKNSLGSKTNEKPSLKLIIEEDEADGMESIKIEEQKLLRTPTLLSRIISICWLLGTVSFTSLLYPTRETAASNPSKAKPAPWPFSALSASFAELGARLRRPGRARLILLHLRIRS